MKKKIVAILSMVFALAFSGAMAAPTLTASANAKKNSIVADDFGDKTYSDSYNDSKWVKLGDEENAVKQASSGDTSATLLFKNDANADNIFWVSTDKYQVKSVTFDAFYSDNFHVTKDEGGSANWGALNFVQTKEKKQSMYSVPLLLRATGFAGNNASVATEAKDYAGEGNWMTFKYEITSLY